MRLTARILEEGEIKRNVLGVRQSRFLWGALKLCQQRICACEDLLEWEFGVFARVLVIRLRWCLDIRSSMCKKIAAPQSMPRGAYT